MKPNFKKKNDYIDSLTKDERGKPAKENVSNETLFISKSAMRNLPKSSYAMIADPYETSSPLSSAYPLLTAFNTLTSASYSGNDNIDGGTNAAYVTSNSSSMLKAFDIVSAFIYINYRYMPILSNDDRGSELINKMRMAISEALSILGATTYTQQPFNDYVVETDMPMGEAIPEEVEDTDHKKYTVYTDLTDTTYAVSMMYQTFLQNISGAFMKFSSMRAYQGEMMRMEYERNTPALNELFSLFNKKAFLATVNSLALSISGEYIDTDWLAQTNTLTNLKSRRSNGILDPLLEVVGCHHMPNNFKLYLFDRASGQIIKEVFDITKWQTKLAAQNEIKELFRGISAGLSCFSVLQWARTKPSTATMYYNQIKQYLDDCIKYANDFKLIFSDFRQILNVMLPTGIVHWARQQRLQLIQDTDVPVNNYLLVRHIITEALSGNTTVQYNETTKRLRSYALWDLYNGIPEFAVKQGGAFISLSAKSAVTGDLKPYIPVAFDLGSWVTGQSIYAKALNREGHQIFVTYTSVKGSADDQLARLFPLPSQSSLNIKVPTIRDNIADKAEASLATKVLLDTFKICIVNSKTHIDPDLIAIYEYEIDDITSNSISYAKYWAPFRGTPTDESSFGFIGTTKK